MSYSVVTLSSFNLLFFTQVLTVLSTTVKYNEYVTDKGKNISIPCSADGFNIMWVKQNTNYSTIVQTGKYLVLTNLTTSDEGVYVCFAAITSRILFPTNITEQQKQKQQQENDNKIDNLRLNETSDSNENSRQTLITKVHLMNSSSVSSSSSSSSSLNATGTNDKHTLSNDIVNKNKNTIPTKHVSTTSMQQQFRINTKTTDDIVSEETAATTELILNNGNNSRSTSSYHLFHPISSSMSTISTMATANELIEQEFRAIEKIRIKVRTTPGPVTQLYFKASTILGFLIWRFNQSNSGGYTIRSFTAEYRNVSYKQKPFNSSFEHEWIRMDPINIAPNVRQMEVYHLEPNTTYEFRIWANNQLGSGEMVTTNVTTLSETKEEDLIRLIQPDLDNFDPRIWIIAVSIVLGTFVILAIGLCVVLTRECYESSRQEFQDGWDGIELIPNIILNPGFHETDSDDNEMIPNLRTIIFRSNDSNNNENRNAEFTDDDDSCNSESDHEPRIEKFKRKLSVFFTDPTIRRI